MAISVDKNVLDDATLDVKVASPKNIVSGAPVAIDDDGKLILSKVVDVSTYGLALFDYNSYRDQVVDTVGGLYGSGKGAVLNIGKATISETTYHDPDGTPHTLCPYDKTKTFAERDPLFVNTEDGITQGNITNVGGVGVLPIGRVVSPPATAGGPMKVIVFFTQDVQLA